MRSSRRRHILFGDAIPKHFSFPCLDLYADGRLTKRAFKVQWAKPHSVHAYRALRTRVEYC
jgi:hypothetical protein